MRNDYVEKLIAALPGTGLDAVLIAPGEELAFLFGISPMMCERFQGMFVKADGEIFYICNLLYKEQIAGGLPGTIPVYSWFDNDDMVTVVSGILKEHGLAGKTIGVNSSVPAFSMLAVGEAADIRFRDAKLLFEEIRISKTPGEMQALRDSAALVDRVFTEIQCRIHPGATEKELQEFLLARMAELGGKSPECIVAAGANASYPHYNENQGIVREQDTVLMDYGCTVDGMYSDMTRTVFVGGATERQREYYELVRRANEEAEQLCVEGAWIPDIDAKAREVLDEKGLAHTLINRLGHGVGYTIHEQPEIKQSDRRKLGRGMAFSIEPGIYLAGDLGIRIEDVVLIDGDGQREILNKSDKSLIIL